MLYYEFINCQTHNIFIYIVYCVNIEVAVIWIMLDKFISYLYGLRSYTMRAYQNKGPYARLIYRT